VWDVCGMCVWDVCVGCVCGMCVWDVCVGCVCGMWGYENINVWDVRYVPETIVLDYHSPIDLCGVCVLQKKLEKWISAKIWAFEYSFSRSTVPNLLFNLQKMSKIFNLKFVLHSLLRNCGERRRYQQASNLVQKSWEGIQKGVGEEGLWSNIE
jgi:hypothetical protein